MTIAHIILGLSLLFILSSFLITLITLIKNNYVNIFRYIGLAQFGIFLMILSITLFYFLDEQTIIAINHSEVVAYITFGHVCGLVGIMFWLIAIAIINLNENSKSLWIIFTHRIQLLFIGFVIGVNMFTLDFIIVQNQLRTIFTYSISYIITPLAYLLFLYSQYNLFRKRVKVNMFKININRSLVYIINIYLTTLLLAIITLTIGFIGIVPTSAWIFFGTVSQLSFSIVLYKIPLVLLTNEQPNMLLVVSNDFDDILYTKRFSKDFNVSEDMIKAYFKGVKILGREIVYGTGRVNRIHFKDNIVLINQFQDKLVCYFYKGISYYSTLRLIKFCNSINRDIRFPHLDTETNNETLLEFESHIDKYFGKFGYLTNIN